MAWIQASRQKADTNIKLSSVKEKSEQNKKFFTLASVWENTETFVHQIKDLCPIYFKNNIKVLKIPTNKKNKNTAYESRIRVLSLGTVSPLSAC